MVTEETQPVETSAVALTVTTLSPEALDRHIAAMTPEQAVEFSLRVSAIASLCSRAKKIANLRLVEMGQTGQVFHDPADGTPYQFTGGRHRKVKDIPALIAQLAVDGVTLKDIVPWMSSSAFKVGDTIIGDARVKDAVNEWAVWEDDPVSLVELDPKTMRPVRR